MDAAQLFDNQCLDFLAQLFVRHGRFYRLPDQRQCILLRLPHYLANRLLDQISPSQPQRIRLRQLLPNGEIFLR